MATSSAKDYPSSIRLPPKLYLDTDVDALTGEFEGVLIGVCAMKEKIFAKSPEKIFSRMAANEHVRIFIFTSDTILNTPVEKWPYCDAFIAFYSKGFPLDKAIRYVELKQPKLVVNDLEKQYYLMDRRIVYSLLEKHDIDVPPYVVVDRSDGDSHSTDVVEIDDDTLEIKGRIFHKPFVEKPVSAEDHNVYFYLPTKEGGGSQRLSRDSRLESVYSSESTIRREGSYIYQEFISTATLEVKVYFAGPDYVHSEVRRSPACGGVDRDNRGKEKRYPILLTPQEKIIAYKVWSIFKQTLGGLDILRSNGTSYVCDVNGCSFMKSEKCFDDCSQILLENILRKLAPQYVSSIGSQSMDYLTPPKIPLPIPFTSSNTQFKLRSIIGIVCPTDHTPKQEMEMIVTHNDFFTLFKELGGYVNGHLKITKAKDLKKVIDIVQMLLDNEETSSLEEKTDKLHKLKTILENNATCSIQFKLLQRNGSHLSTPALLLILKWGSEATSVGLNHAQELGKEFRCMYPRVYSNLLGSGLVRLHNLYHHDVKIYASNECCVQMTAAAFTNGLLNVEGNLAAILINFITSDQTAINMLDTLTDTAEEELSKVKQTLHQYMQANEDFNQESVNKLAPTLSQSLLDATQAIKNPHKACETVSHCISQFLQELRNISLYHPNLVLYQGETLDQMIKRWSKLYEDFCLASGKFNINKIHDICDGIKYDLQHNSALTFQYGLSLYKNVIHLADIVISQEYGITVDEKLSISQKVCKLLLQKIRADLRHISSNNDTNFLQQLDPEEIDTSSKSSVRTRFYFTDKLHVDSLINALKYGSLISDVRWTSSVNMLQDHHELNHLAQVLFIVLEDISQPSQNGLFVETYVSQGVKSMREILLKGEYLPCVSHGLKEGKLLTKDLTVDDNLSLESHYDNGFSSLMSMIEPFVPVCSAPLENMDIFLTKLNVEDQKISLDSKM